jgi:hypothetical protein
MKRIFRRAILAASSLGVVGGIVLTATPASAAPIPVESWGASATGPFSLPPVAYATSFNTPGVALRVPGASALPPTHNMTLGYRSTT